MGYKRGQKRQRQREFREREREREEPQLAQRPKSKLAEQEVELPIFRPKEVKPHTRNHAAYLQSIDTNLITICAGPAGTGKTWMACARAARVFKSGDVERIILCRPAVECGEKLGFLPGELDNKLGPYVLPMFDALGDFLPAKEIAELAENKVIELCPLAYMRGRTIRNGFIILDEAQNASYEQLKMFVTRYGENTRMVVCGDTSQSDLPKAQRNDFEKVIANLEDIKGIGIVHLDERDIMRHPLVEEICKRL